MNELLFHSGILPSAIWRVGGSWSIAYLGHHGLCHRPSMEYLKEMKSQRKKDPSGVWASNQVQLEMNEIFLSVE